MSLIPMGWDRDKHKIKGKYILKVLKKISKPHKKNVQALDS